MQVRFLDFGNNTPKSGFIGKPRYIGWPVDAYRVTLPKTINSENDLNPFEKVILGIMRAEHLRDADRIAKETCLWTDESGSEFVREVLARLKDKGLIDEQLNLTKTGTSRLSGEGLAGLELRTAWVFKELVSGKMIPFIYLPKNDRPPYWKDEPHNVKKLSGANFIKPSSQDVLDVMVETKKRLRDYGAVIKLPPPGQIDVMATPERYYLDCPIVIGETDGRWRIADPFGFGYSRALGESFLTRMDEDEELQRWISDWRNGIVVGAPQFADQDREGEVDADTRRLYPMVFENCFPSNGDRLPISQVYAAIEWAFYYSCKRFEFEDQVAELEFSTKRDQAILIRNVLKKMGAEGTSYFRPVDTEALKRFPGGVPTMRVVLALSILQAASDPNHPLRALCETHPDFVARIGRMEERRNSPQHGGDGSRMVEVGSPDDQLMKSIISTLLPGVHFQDVASPSVNANMQFANDTFNARNAVENEFGPVIPYTMMSRGAREALIGAEREWLSFKDGDSAQLIVNELYAALQAVLDKELASGLLDRPAVTDFDAKRAARDHALNANFETLSAGLLSTGDGYVRDAIQGGQKNHTLGASLIAFLALASEERLSRIASDVPGFISTICEIITIRKHGNEAPRKNRATVARYRESVYECIRAILEV